MSDLGQTLKIVELEGDLQASRTAIRRLQQLLSCAICAQCSDELGDEEFALDEEERLCHKRCVKA